MNAPDTNLLEKLCARLLPAVLEAGRAELAHFSAGVTIEKKADKSPVTVADREAEAILLSALAQIAPNIPVVAEEAAAEGKTPPPANKFSWSMPWTARNCSSAANPNFRSTLLWLKTRSRCSD